MVEVYHGSEISYLMEGLTAGRTYRCRVCAISDGGEGTWSPPAQLSTPATLPTPPLQLRLSGNVTATHAALQWGQQIHVHVHSVYTVHSVCTVHSVYTVHT